MKTYIYETHLHTKEASACGGADAKDYIALYKEKGYTGIFVTDHFFNGNSRVPKDLPWEERVEMYCSGYEHAKEEGDRVGFDVFFGIEANFQGDEYLLYGPDKKWLKEHPEIMIWTRDELREEIHKIGGIMIQAHPFRDRDYLDAIRVHPGQADACEGYNMCNPEYCDQYAFEFASGNGIKMVSGSDIHHTREIDRPLGGVCFTERLSGPKDYAKRILEADVAVPLIKKDGVVAAENVAKLNSGNYGFFILPERMKADPGNTTFGRDIILTDKNGEDRVVNSLDVLGVKYNDF